MKDLVKRSSAALSVLLAGVAVELVLAVVKAEPLNLVRFLTLVGFIVVMLLVIEVAVKRELSRRVVVAGGLFAIGLIAVAVGVGILFSPSFVRNATLANVVGMGIISSGVIVFISGMFIRRQRDVFAPEDRNEFRDRDGGQPRALRGQHAIELITFSDAPQSMVDLCREQISTRDLHFVSYYVDDACVFYAHVLNNPLLADMMGTIPADSRRKRYEAYGRLVHSLVGRLDATYSEVRQGELVRVVLDVRQGAFYHCRIDPYRFFFGVTLDQEQVDAADDKMRRIASAAQRFSGEVTDPFIVGSANHPPSSADPGDAGGNAGPIPPPIPPPRTDQTAD